MKESSSINIEDVIEAFNIVTMGRSSGESINLASTFLHECQIKPNFSYILLNIYCNSKSSAVQLQSILLLKNIIKRNWTSHRNREENLVINESEKKQLRKSILQVYTLHQMQFSKNIDEMLKFLVRSDFPAKYEQLSQFILQNLNILFQLLSTSSSMQNIYITINSKQLINILSTCKTIVKEYSLKKTVHCEEHFIRYILPIIKVCLEISKSLHQLIGNMNDHTSNEDFIGNLIECTKKVDKVILYGLSCMHPALQYEAYFAEIIHKFIQYINQYDRVLAEPTLKSHPYAKQIIFGLENYIIYALELVSKIQHFYPFLFTNFLRPYLDIILNMLLYGIPANKYHQEKLISIIILANLKPFTCFAFYMNPEEFKGSIYSKKGTVNNLPQQSACYNQFRQIFTQQNITIFLSKILEDVMTCKVILASHPEIQDEYILQDHENTIPQNSNEQPAFENCISLCKQIIRCFKNEVKEVLKNLFLSVCNLKQESLMQNPSLQNILNNSMELILILPKLYEYQQLSIDHVLELMKALYREEQYIFLSRLIKVYHQAFNENTIRNCFEILTQIVARPLNHHSINPEVIYQAAIAIKKILHSHEIETLPLENLSPCIKNIAEIMMYKEFINSPNLLWPMITLTNQLTQVLPIEFIQNDIALHIINGIMPATLIQNNYDLTVCALAELLANILNNICQCFRMNLSPTIEKPTPNLKCIVLTLTASYLLIRNNLQNKSIENIENIYKLWLTTMRNYPSIHQQQFYLLNSENSSEIEIQKLNNQYRMLYMKNYQKIANEEYNISVEIFEEYIITQLLHINQQQVLEVFQIGLQNQAEKERICSMMALFSMYFSYSLTNNKIIPQIIVIMIKQLTFLMNKISPQINSLRTFILLIFHQHILTNSSGYIYELLNNAFDNQSWFLPYCISLQFVANKFIYKLNAVAIFKTISDQSAATFAQMITHPIDGQYPIDIILKVLHIQLQPMKIEVVRSALNSLHKSILPNQINTNSHSTILRKVRLHITPLIQNIIQNDFRTKFTEVVGQIIKFLDWDRTDLEQRFNKTVVDSIICLLQGKLDSEKDYSVQQQ